MRVYGYTDLYVRTKEISRKHLSSCGPHSRSHIEEAPAASDVRLMFPGLRCFRGLSAWCLACLTRCGLVRDIRSGRPKGSLCQYGADEADTRPH